MGSILGGGRQLTNWLKHGPMSDWPNGPRGLYVHKHGLTTYRGQWVQDHHWVNCCGGWVNCCGVLGDGKNMKKFQKEREKHEGCKMLMTWLIFVAGSFESRITTVVHSLLVTKNMSSIVIPVIIMIKMMIMMIMIMLHWHDFGWLF